MSGVSLYQSGLKYACINTVPSVSNSGLDTNTLPGGLFVSNCHEDTVGAVVPISFSIRGGSAGAGDASDSTKPKLLIKMKLWMLALRTFMFCSSLIHIAARELWEHTRLNFD